MYQMTILTLIVSTVAVAGLALLAGILINQKKTRKEINAGLQDLFRSRTEREEYLRKRVYDLVETAQHIEAEQEALREQIKSSAESVRARMSEIAAKTETGAKLFSAQLMASLADISNHCEAISVDSTALHEMAQEHYSHTQKRDGKSMPVGERYSAMKQRLEEGATIKEVAAEFGYSRTRNAERFLRNYEKSSKK